jgi:hypothetical protein
MPLDLVYSFDLREPRSRVAAQRAGQINLLDKFLFMFYDA